MAHKKVWDNYEDLPLKESNKHYKYRKLRSEWRYGGDIFASEKSPYRIAERILHHNIGKSFDMAFSYYCTKVNKRFQYIFLEYFESSWRKSLEWSVDEKGNIVYNKFKYGPPRKVTFYSEDYKSDIFHKITGKRKSNFNPWSTRDDEIIKEATKQGLWEMRTIQGWRKEFSSVNDPEYKRLSIDKAKRERIKLRKEKKEKSLTKELLRFYLNRHNIWEREREENRIRRDAFIQKIEERKRQENLETIERHGFDPKESFKRRKTNKLAEYYEDISNPHG